MRRTLPLLLGVAIAALGGLLFGFDTAVISGTTRALSTEFHLTPATLGVTVSCALWGTVLGGLFASIPAERLGGRESLRLTAVLYFASAVGCALSRDWGSFLLFRFLGGLAIGGCSVFGPMYIAETSPAHLRGRLVACFQLSIVTGILLAYASNFALSLLRLGAREWRFDLGVAAIPAVFFFLALAFIPRSPRWLLRQGRVAEATRALEQMGFDNPAAEVAKLQSALALDLAVNRARITQSLFSPAFRKPLLIALALGLFNQLSGINAILYYLNDIFAFAGYSRVSAGRQAVAVGVANLLFTLVGMALIDRIGRRLLLLIGAVGMAATLAGVAAIFLQNRGQHYLLPLLLIFIAFFAASQGAVVWVYLSEIFPGAVRERGQGFASFWLWLLTALVAGLFPRLAAVSSGYPFALFAIVMVVQFFVVLVAFPETKGRSLEQIGQEVETSAT